MQKYQVNMYDSIPAPLNSENKEISFFESEFFCDENKAIDFAKSLWGGAWIKIEVKDTESNKVIYEV
ncbi:MAG: hypothetical protein JW864_07585 [Spirochaetes bacterium]|nr:hypothetical protein [Spirochaetota bacterium]